jgi:glycerate kinase
MKIVLAPDKFKGSLTAFEFCDAVEKGLKKILPNAEILQVPLADGGDGTIDIIHHYMQGDFVQVEVNDPFFRNVTASYLYSKEQEKAFIEMAEASGAKLLKREELNVMEATTFGTGELIKDALDRGAQSIILGIGGSATNDCGIGMATALGYEFLDANNQSVKPIGKNLSSIKKMTDANIHPRLKEVTFQLACDVSNPLYGPNGAAHVYSRQKGASEEEVFILDQGLQDFSKVLDAHFAIESQQIAGAGAAGGMGIGAKTFLNGTMVPGIELIKELANFNMQIQDSDWIITGEGKLDEQTKSGKTIQGILNSAGENTQIAAFCGKIDLSKKEYQELGIRFASEVMSKAIDFEDALENTAKYVTQLAEDFAKSFSSIK